MTQRRGCDVRFGALVVLCLIALLVIVPVPQAAEPEDGDPIVCRHDAIKRHYLDADWDGFLDQYRGLPLNECPHAQYLLARSLWSRAQVLDLVGYVRYFGASSEQRERWVPWDLFRDLLSQNGFPPEEIDDHLKVGKGFSGLSQLGVALMRKLADKGYLAAKYEMHPSIVAVLGASNRSHGSWPDDQERERLGYGVHVGSLEAARLVLLVVSAESWHGANVIPEAAENLLLHHATHGFPEAAVWLTAAYERGAFGGVGTDRARRMSEIASNRLHWPVGSPIPLPSGMSPERLQQIGEAVGSIFREIRWSDTDDPAKGTRLCDPSDTQCVIRLMNSLSSCQMRNMALISRAEVLASELHWRCVENRMALYRFSMDVYVPHRIAPILPRLPHERDIVH